MKRTVDMRVLEVQTVQILYVVTQYLVIRIDITRLKHLEPLVSLAAFVELHSMQPERELSNEKKFLIARFAFRANRVSFSYWILE